ncbi:MAG: nitrogen fixation protein NifU [Candidatus Syntrophoarchaeum butanivorans]|uniref:Nitrogen fixation protein NifU n=2 Tax=Candidatus Syntropharchaeum butanivorans TaxID=1839936 RepID=A0A1F2P5W6_9EURY|nr:MAG: nitrogen fixation protein NifU [Candidatus Syntrophoarchaeum butanivorans]
MKLSRGVAMAEKVSTLDELVDDIQQAIIRDALEIFSERVVEEALNPKNVGMIEDPDGASRITGPCGDTMEIYLKIEDERIIEARFLTDGCGPTIACGSVLTELIRGKTVEEASRLNDEEILSVLGDLPEEHLHCPVLAVNTLKEAIADYRRRKGGG